MAGPVRKAWALLIRGSARGPELLLFRHPEHEVLEVPKGGVERGESPAEAAVRELWEETGLEGGRVVETLPLLDADPRVWGNQLWHAFVVTVDRELPDAWDHTVGGNSGERGLVYGCRFVPLAQAVDLVDPHQREVVALAADSGWANARLWDAKAAEWDGHVGEHGDQNRRLNSDPVLWRFLGVVEGEQVLDAGCGTGYLAAKLVAAGASVDGVDVSEGMVSLASERVPDAAIRVDDLMVLETCADGRYDAVVTNYVLMDLPDLPAAVRQIARVLRPGGRLVAVFSHPNLGLDGGYFERGPRRESWGPFSTDFVFWHRPLRDYLQAFLDAGLALEAFEEPVVDAGADLDPEERAHLRRRPFSVAVRCRRTT